MMMLIKGIPHEKWNERSGQLVQAMLGAISPNFRMATIDHDGREWVLTFYLEKENAEDLEEIEDIAFEFEVLHQDAFRYKTIITASPLSTPEPVIAEAVFKRREN
jgi:hypothetical protein